MSRRDDLAEVEAEVGRMERKLANLLDKGLGDLRLTGAVSAYLVELRRTRDALVVEARS